MGAILDEVVGPDMVGVLWSKTDTRPIIEPQPATLELLLRNLQPFTLADPFHTAGTDVPALRTQHRRNAAIAMAAVLACQADDRRRQGLLIGHGNPHAPLRRTRLTQIAAGLAFAETKLLAGMHHTAPATLGACQFPSAASLSTCFSSAMSATRWRSQAFSRSNSLRRRA